MAKNLIVHTERCTACRACELACSMKHHGLFSPSRSRIQVNVFLEDAVYIPTACTQCDQAWCVKICPTGAIVRDQATLAYTVTKEKCVGCKMCVLACPFGSMMLFAETGKAEKCDHCLSVDGQPECVKFCTPKALEYLAEDSEVRLRQMATARKLRETFVEPAA
jgi:anaerobic carbon-monoxide dehydrogenase iron sulfur subunit